MSISKKYHKKLAGAGLVVIACLSFAVISVNAQVGARSEPEEKETAITGAALDKASATALKHTNGGQVRETEVGDEESYYEVEVAKDGQEIDVQLNESFQVVGDKTETDQE